MQIFLACEAVFHNSRWIREEHSQRQGAGVVICGAQQSRPVERHAQAGKRQPPPSAGGWQAAASAASLAAADGAGAGSPQTDHRGIGRNRNPWDALYRDSRMSRAIVRFEDKGMDWRQELPMAAWTKGSLAALRIFKAMGCDSILKLELARVRWSGVFGQ
jgi:hypothetical protein